MKKPLRVALLVLGILILVALIILAAGQIPFLMDTGPQVVKRPFL